ncbi:uncharacterized protein LOC128506193 [Clarias gariepinus]|uniref:uncharacterized protein LOC128506193 n=1 Tax=Clarias gariepinus TaxID=13013 RepID=UPI00234C5332|nr:uncharacterized protein LOC128506193 [Clarias gariepinus]
MPGTNNTILTTTASPATSFKTTPSVGTTVTMPGTNNSILTTTAPTATSFQTTPSVETTVKLPGTTVKMPDTNNTILTTTAPTATKFKTTPSARTTGKMPGTNNTILTTTASPAKSFQTTPSVGTTVKSPGTTGKMPGTNNTILTTTASPAKSFQTTPSVGTTVKSPGTTVKMPDTNNTILTTTASPATRFKTTPSVGTTGKMPGTNNTILTTTASPATSFKTTSSVGTTVTMPGTNNSILTTTAPTTTSFQTTPSVETTVKTPGINNTILTTTASPAKSFQTTPFVGTTVKLPGTTVKMPDTNNTILTTTASPATKFKTTPSAGTTGKMPGTNNTILTTTASPATSFKTTSSVGTTVTMPGTNNSILTTTAPTATSFKTTPSVETTVKTPGINNTILTTTASPAKSFQTTPSVGTTVKLPGTTVKMPDTNNTILTTTASPATKFKTTPSAGTTGKMPGTNNTILTTTASPATSFKTTSSVGTTVKTPGTTVKMPDTNNTILTTTASPATRFKTTPSVGTTVTMPGTNNSILTTTTPTTTSLKTTPSVETTVKTPGINNTILTTTASLAKSFQTTPSVGSTVKTPGTTVKMPDTNNTILITTASPVTSFKTTPSVGTTVKTPDTNNTILTPTASPTLPPGFTVNPCQGVDSQAVKTMLSHENASAVLCNFSITDYACSSGADLSADDLAKLLTCKLTGKIKYSKDVWKIFLYNVAAHLEEALKLYIMNLSNIQSDPNILDAIGEVIISNFTTEELINVTFISEWFQVRLRPFLSSVSTEFLSSLSFKNFSCITYQIVVEALSSQETLMNEDQKQSVFTTLIFPFLSRVDLPDPGCVSDTSGSNDWLAKNLGNFSAYALWEELNNLNENFSSVAVLGLLSSEQKAQFILQPDSGVLGNESVFREVFSNMVASLDLNQLGSFFTAFNQTSKQMNSSISTAISEIILNVTLLNLAPDFQSFSPEEFALWFQTYLSFFLPVIGPNTLSVIPMNISGDSYREIVIGLDNVYSHLTNTQSNTVFNHTLDYLQYQSSQGLRYYSSGSFFMFLNQFFRSFGFPNLKDFLSLIPADRQAEILDSISVEELSEFLNRPDAVTDGAELCTLLNNYNMTNQYLEREPVLSSALASLTLACVWPQALRASSPADVEQWFDVTLVNYLPYLTFQLISSTQLSEASCLSYRKLVSVLGKNYNFSATNFAPADVYSSIRAYLTNNDGRPRCFNSSDPLLNSTAWFADNIGFFFKFITLTDLQSYISDSKIGVFLENSENLQLFNNLEIATSVTKYYTTQLYIQDPNFNPIRLPGGLLCDAPASAFTSLGETDSQAVLIRINNKCKKINPQVTATLVAKFSTLSATSIEFLGNQSVGLTVGQISSAPSEVINSALSTFSTISGWDQGQANALIQSIISAGFHISSGSSLLSLGTLIGGVPSATISSIPSSQLLSLSQNPTFINNIQSAPTILQETFIQKIISADETNVIRNVPGSLAMYIPVVLLSSLSSGDVLLVNNQKWSHDQAQILFGAVASASDNTEDLSTSVLQGFSCTSVQTVPQQKIQNLVKACRPRPNRQKVSLKESQLTCMYNTIKEDSVDFSDVPSDMLLYYSYDKVVQENCRSYFTSLGAADFSIPSAVLNKPATLFANAQGCLGISGVKLTRDQVGILGNMTCTLDSSYIQNSDPLILENLKNCGDLSESQKTAVNLQLLSGNTVYGNPLKWTMQTLEQLGTLPLYFNSYMWGLFSSDLKIQFLQYFMPLLRNQKTPVQKLKNLFTACNSQMSKVRRAAGCTTGNITTVTIADEAFPVGYDSTQFDLCLDNSVLLENLAAITEKVVDTSFQTVILNKLNQIYPSGLNDSVLQLLGSSSRVATIDDISKWNINMIDTLSSLMNSDNGNWTPNMGNAVITRYLRIPNHTLGTSEINTIGSNICSLDVNILKTITADSLKNANSLDVSSCSIEKKQALYIIRKSSFNGQGLTSAYYQLIRPYLGGAPIQDIQSLSTMNVNMDITTFLNLNPDVIMALNVSTVQGLLTMTIADLKLFENSSVIQSWVAQQDQSDLDTLKLGLKGGKITAVTPQAANTTVTISQTNETTTLNTTPQTSGAPAVYDGAAFLLLCVGVLTHLTHVFHTT